MDKGLPASNGQEVTRNLKELGGSGEGYSKYRRGGSLLSHQ